MHDGHMGSTERPADRGRRRGRVLLRDAVAEFRRARVDASLSQALIGRALGRSDAWVSWTESGRNESLSVVDMSAMLACSGLELSLRAYPSGGGLRDAPQIEILAEFRGLVVPPWGWASEVPMPIAGDLRAWDCVLSRAVFRVGVDAESRLRDAQAVDRRVMLKQRDSGVDRAVILIRGTRSNRAALHEFGHALRANFPIPSAVALQALREGKDPGGNAIIILNRRGSGTATRW